MGTIKQSTSTRIGALLLATGAMLITLLVSLTVGVAGASEGALTISEFIADPSKVTDTHGEWVEITNSTGSDIDLSGWDIDGSTITPNIVVPAGSGVVICKNTDPLANGGVVCQGKSSFSLNNSSDTIALRDQNNQVVTSVVYTASDVATGYATENTDGVLSKNTVYQYGLGDFGSPINNEFGLTIVHGLTEKNNNEHPDLLGNEKIEAGHKINLYKINSDGSWTLRNSAITTDKYFPESAYFVTSPGDYAVCMEVPEGFYDTFAKRIDGYFQYSHHSVSNPSALNKDPLCSQVLVETNKGSQHIMGIKKKIGPNGILRVHVMNDTNGDGMPGFLGGEQLQSGWNVHLFSAQAWEDPGISQPTDSVVTTGLSYGQSAELEILESSDYWVICLERKAGLGQTFAREITSYVTFPDRSEPNTKDTATYYENCEKVTLKSGQLRSILFGTK